jgi:hypothetical protein
MTIETKNWKIIGRGEIEKKKKSIGGLESLSEGDSYSLLLLCTANYNQRADVYSSLLQKLRLCAPKTASLCTKNCISVHQKLHLCASFWPQNLIKPTPGRNIHNIQVHFMKGSFVLCFECWLLCGLYWGAGCNGNFTVWTDEHTEVRTQLYQA